VRGAGASADFGLTHVAFAVADLERSVAFYQRYAAMQVVHRRGDGHSEVAWMSDFTRPFVVVLARLPGQADTPLGPFGHLGVACRSRADVDRLAQQAAAEGVLRAGPTDSGPPVGYWALIADPDGNTLEVAHGQEVAFTVGQAQGEPG
jgi:catechol 2,3-dioxygenase-like lactoylglutathione lyase family enzyme